MAKRALITGITGQDGSYLAELLLFKGYEVHGMLRRASTFNTGRINHIYIDPHKPDARLFLHYGDLSDAEQISNLVYNIKPDEIYHLGAQSHVRVSFDIPEYTGNVVALGTARILEAIRRSGQQVRFYQAASSEIFGSSKPPQSEESVFKPRSPYAAAKLYSYWMVKNYREGYGIFASNGILFNHESPRRGETFVTRKITRAVASMASGKKERLYLGNLDSKRDWGYAPEYVEAMWKILKSDSPGDFVVGTGENHSVRELVEEAFGYAGVKIEWVRAGSSETGRISSLDGPRFNGWKPKETVVEIDPKYFRPTEVENLFADAEKIKKQLLWSPRVNFRDLVKIMLDADLRQIGLTPPGEGDGILREKFPEKWWKGD